MNDEQRLARIMEPDPIVWTDDDEPTVGERRYRQRRAVTARVHARAVIDAGWRGPGAVQDESRTDRLLDLAWGVIANASGGRWEEQEPEWQDAATRWRDDWHAHMGIGPGGPPPHRRASAPVPALDVDRAAEVIEAVLRRVVDAGRNWPSEPLYFWLHGEPEKRTTTDLAQDLARRVAGDAGRGGTVKVSCDRHPPTWVHDVEGKHVDPETGEGGCPWCTVELSTLAPSPTTGTATDTGPAGDGEREDGRRG